MADAERIHVEVAYAGPRRQRVMALTVPVGTTVAEAIALSGIGREFPEIDLATAKAGIYARLVPGSEILREGDRVEIYRPLIADPKEARKARAAGLKKGGAE